MIVEDSRPRTASKLILNSMTTSVGRFYEKRHQLNGALDQYNKALLSNPDDTATYIDRSRVFLKMGSIDKAQEDTNLALNLIEDKKQNSNLLSYYVYLQKAEILYADGEFELALMYFHRANKIKPAQQICLEGIRKITDILECTICNSNIHLTITNNLNNNNNNKEKQINLLNRSPIRKQLPLIEIPLTKYTDKEANQFLVEIAKDRKLLINIYKDKQSLTGLNKAKIEARQTISIVESQLKFLDKSECFYLDEKMIQKYITCTPEMDQTTLVRIAEQELMYLQQLSSKENSIEILYRSMKIINCLHSSDDINNSSLDLRTRLMLAEAFRLVGQSYNEIKLFDQSIEYYKQAYKILLPIKNENCLYRSLFDISQSLILANKYSEAIEIFLEMFNKVTTDNERAFIYQNISICYLNINNYDQAKHYAYKALDYTPISIEGNILLGKIYFKLNDFQHAEEYISYAENLKDQLDDLDQMKYFDELIIDMKNSKEKIFSLIQFKTKDLNQQWISLIMQENENKQQQINNKNISNWRILTPYHRLFDICNKFC